MYKWELTKSCVLFEGIGEERLNEMLKCLAAYESDYSKGENVFLQGDKSKHLGIVLSGELVVYSDDYWGNTTIMSKLHEGDIFGESFAFAQADEIGVSVAALCHSCVLFIDISSILSPCTVNCQYHNTLIRNAVRLLADKNLRLLSKINHLSKRSTREKLLSYLSEQARRNSSNRFNIPFDRQQLADFLSVDRSAMSRELSNMKHEGMIDYWKNSFVLLK